MTVTCIVGAQTGSEAKGNLVGHLAGGYQIHLRVGAANAGHTVYVDGDRHVLQQLPCAAYANPWAKLVLGAGAMISPDILIHEIVRNVDWRQQRDLPPLRLMVDYRAHAVTQDHIRLEQQSDLAKRIGSTSAVAREGIGAAQAARVMRTGYQLAQDVDGLHNGIGQYIYWCDTVELLHDALIFGSDILLEGTQGTGLSNTTGLYPYVTSRNVSASGIAADCGLGPRDIDSVIIVARTYPIRVAGNSGPFWPGSREIQWEEIGIDPETERTTVTKKIRRVATFSMEQIKHAVRVNSATEICLSFCDYLCPEMKGRAGVIEADECDQFDYVGKLVRDIEQFTFTPVTYLATSPTSILERQPPVAPDGKLRPREFGLR